MPCFPGRVVAKVECLPARRAVIGAPPVPIVDDWLDGEKMSAARSESGRQGGINRAREVVEYHVGTAGREEIFALKRPRFIIGTECVETDIYPLKINRLPNETTGVNAVDICDHINIIGDFAVHAVGCP